MGIEQRIEHDRLVPRIRLSDAAVEEVARLAWRFDAHALSQEPPAPNSLRAFVAGYREGYRLVAYPGRATSAALAMSAQAAR